VSRHLSGAERANERMASATAAAAVIGGVCPLPAMGTRYAFGTARASSSPRLMGIGGPAHHGRLLPLSRWRQCCR
jgi:hypothetical protein